MRAEDIYFQTLNEAELWQRYAGYLDLSPAEFMSIQEELLLDQINRVSTSFLGKKFFGDSKPLNVREFREKIPLTGYDDYDKYLNGKNEENLSEKPEAWCHSSGKGGEYKWVPYTKDFLDVIARRCITCMMVSSAARKGQVNVAPGSRFLIIMPPPPYASGVAYEGFAKRFTFKSMPPQESSSSLSFQDRVKIGFQMALRDGIDSIASLASVMVSSAKEFSGQSKKVKITRSMLHPRVLWRLGNAYIKSKRAGRPILPSDLWKIKSVVTGGVDVGVYENDIKHYWGADPCEVYGATEAGGMMALESWNRKGMVFFPDVVFLEFIPYQKQSSGASQSSNNNLKTVLLSELKEGGLYEVVITQLYGMPLLRYRMKDIIKVVSLGDKEAGISLPHIVFERRLGELINIGGLADLDEKTMWQALTDSGIKTGDWAAVKEYDQNKAFIRLYLESSDGNADEVSAKIDKQLRLIDTDYADLNVYLDLNPIKITFLKPGTFQLYVQEKLKEGADLAHIKPAHMNAPENAVKRLLELNN